MKISDANILIIATHGFEQSELEVPRDKLTEMGANVKIASPETGSITGWKIKDWGEPVSVDASVEDVKAEDFDALVLPGGQINPDLLRVNERVIELIQAFHRSAKPVAAICHAPWLLIEAGIINGVRATSYKSIITDMKNAGAAWEDSEAVSDRNIITSRNPDDLDAFINAIGDALEKRETPAREAAPA